MSTTKTIIKKNTYLALPACVGASFESQKIPFNATAFPAPNWTLRNPKTNTPNTFTGEAVIELGLAKFVAAILKRAFDARETISFETVFRACLAQYLTIKAGLNDKPLLFAWKALPPGRQQFTFGARLPSPQIACERHKAPTTDDETGALPLFDGKSMFWYPFVAQDTCVHQYNQAQWELLIAYGITLDQEVAELKIKSKEASLKRFNESIELAMKVTPPLAEVKIEIRQATLEEEDAVSKEDNVSIEFKEQINA